MKQLLLLLILPVFTFSQTLQEQINNTSEGGILFVYSGTYYESIVIDKSISFNCAYDDGPCIIDASGFVGGIHIEASNVEIDGFEIIGDENTTYGIVITPTCSDITLEYNTIHGMSLPNTSNTSPLSYGILAYGNSIIDAPTNLNFSNNTIYNTAGSGISLGSFTGSVNIENNTISDLMAVNVLGEDLSVGIQAQAAEYVTIENNNFINLLIGSNLIFTNGELQNNTYNNTVALLTHTTFAPIAFEDEVDWWSVDGTIEYLGLNFDITSYFNSLENAIIIASQNKSNILGYDGVTYDSDGNPIIILGCTDSQACNYNENANTSNDSCEYAYGCDSCSGEIDGTGMTVDGDTDNDGICDLWEIYGCDDDTACNYSTFVTENDGSCSFPSNPCELENEDIGIYNDLCECIEINSTIHENNINRKLLHTIDILGRETTNKGFQLHIYDDGSVEKKYLVK